MVGNMFSKKVSALFPNRRSVLATQAERHYGMHRLSALLACGILGATPYAVAQSLAPEVPPAPLPSIPGRDAPRLGVIDLNPAQVSMGVQQDLSFVQASVFNAGRQSAGSAVRAGTALTRSLGTGFVVEARPGRSEAVLQTVFDAAPGLRLGVATGRSWHREHYLGQPSRQDVTQEHWAVSLKRQWSGTTMSPDMRIAAYAASAHGGNRIDQQSDDFSEERIVDGGLQRGASLRLGLSPTSLTRVAYGVHATVTDFSHDDGKPAMTHSIALQQSLDRCTRLRTSMETNGRDSTLALGLQQPSWRMELRHNMQADGVGSSAVHLFWQTAMGAAPADRSPCREPLTILPATAPISIEAMHRPNTLPWSPAVRVISGG